MNKTSLYLIILVIFAVILLVVVFAFSFFLSFQKKGASNPPAQSALPSEIPSITSPLIKDFIVTTVVPSENISIEYLPVREVEFTFSDVVDPANFFIKVVPEVKTIIRYKNGFNNTVIVSPELNWVPGITTITILPTTKSINNIPLKKEYTYSIKAAFPQNPPNQNDVP